MRYGKGDSKIESTLVETHENEYHCGNQPENTQISHGTVVPLQIGILGFAILAKPITTGVRVGLEAPAAFFAFNRNYSVNHVFFGQFDTYQSSNLTHVICGFCCLRAIKMLPPPMCFQIPSARSSALPGVSFFALAATSENAKPKTP